MNRLPATITAVEAHGSIALVEAEAGGHRFSATLIGAGDDIAAWQAGMPVTLLFKETEVSLARNLSGLISMRNRIPVTVTAIERGTVLARVSLSFAGHRIESIITTRSSHALTLEAGDVIEALVKSNEMNLLPERPA